MRQHLRRLLGVRVVARASDKLHLRWGAPHTLG
jgi:hypothetical protein